MFREVQRFSQWWFWALLMIPIAVLGFTLRLQTRLGQTVTHPAASNRVLMAVTGSLVLLVLLLSQAKLITEVREDALSIRFFLLWKQRVIPWRTIESAEAVTYNPIEEFGGWGVRWGRTGMAYNVSGSQGVRLRLTNGQTVLIGSQRPEELTAAIQGHIGQHA